MIINLPESNSVEILGISIKFICKVCGNKFGVYLDDKGQLPLNYDVCFKCEGRKKYLESIKKEIVNYGHEIK